MIVIATMQCKYCHQSVKADTNEVKEVTCGMCTQILISDYKKAQDLIKQQYKPSQSKKLRKEKRWSQKDLAIKLGIPVHHISMFEQGKEPPVQKLMEYLDNAK